MSSLPLILAGLLGVALLVGYAAVLIGMRREDRRGQLPYVPPGPLEAFARWVTGCRVQQKAATFEENDPWWVGR